MTEPRITEATKERIEQWGKQARLLVTDHEFGQEHLPQPDSPHHRILALIACIKQEQKRTKYANGGWEEADLKTEEQQATIERYERLILELCAEGAVKPMVQSPKQAKVDTYVYLSKKATATLKEVIGD